MTGPGDPRAARHEESAKMDLSVMDLLRNRDLTVPAEDAAPIEAYWTKMRRLRAEVDETLLADHEIAVTWTPVEAQG